MSPCWSITSLFFLGSLRSFILTRRHSVLHHLYQYKIQLFASLKKSFVITHRKDNRLVTVREGIKPDLA
jgi:hypothetical protein